MYIYVSIVYGSIYNLIHNQSCCSCKSCYLGKHPWRSLQIYLGIAQIAIAPREKDKQKYRNFSNDQSITSRITQIVREKSFAHRAQSRRQLPLWEGRRRRGGWSHTCIFTSFHLFLILFSFVSKTFVSNSFLYCFSFQLPHMFQILTWQRSCHTGFLCHSRDLREPRR